MHKTFIIKQQNGPSFSLLGLAISLPKPHILLHEEKKIVAIFVTRCNASNAMKEMEFFLDILDLMEETFF